MGTDLSSADEDTDEVGLTLIPGSGVDVDDESIRLAIRLVDLMDVMGTLGEWKAAERKGLGGRPETFPMHAVLVALVLCALTDEPLRLRRVRNMMFVDLSPRWRSVLGIPDPPLDHDEQGWLAAERNVRTRFHSMLDLMDPSPTPKNRRLGDEEYRAEVKRRRAKRSDEEWAIRYDRLEFFINRLLEASMLLLPPEVRRAWNGSVGVDATVVPSFSRWETRSPGSVRRGAKPGIETHSADPDAGWYRRDPDPRDEDGDPGDKRPGGMQKSIWGYDASIVVSGPDTPGQESVFPNLTVAMAVLDKPSVSPGRNGARALANLRSRGHPAGYVAGDRAYSNAVADDFQLVASALGFQPGYDYKVTQLGIQDSYHGFLLIEGAYYCPMIPQALIDATRDFRKPRRNETAHQGHERHQRYQQQLKERWRYLARPKALPDDEGHVRLQCPAASQWLLARCELKPASVSDKNRGRLRILPTAQLKASPPASCTQQSVMIPPEAGAKFRQPLLFQSAEWSATYNLLRNTTESMNGYVKDPGHEALHQPGRRRVHGVAAQSVFAALLLMAANVRKIRTFLAMRRRPRTGGSRPRPRRRGTRSIETWRPASRSVAPASGPDPPLTA